MYVTPDISGVEIKILGAAAQPLGAKIEILGVLAQPLAWRKGVAHKDGNSWRTLAYTVAPQDIRQDNTLNSKFILLFIQSHLLDLSMLRHVLLYFCIDLF